MPETSHCPMVERSLPDLPMMADRRRRIPEFDMLGTTESRRHRATILCVSVALWFISIPAFAPTSPPDRSGFAISNLQAPICNILLQQRYCSMQKDRSE